VRPAQKGDIEAGALCSDDIGLAVTDVQRPVDTEVRSSRLEMTSSAP